MNTFSCCYRKVEVGPTFKIMATLRQENPKIHVCTSGSEAIVHIHQFIYTDDDQTSFKGSQDGVKMTLMQFRSLMFHLRALDMQFTQKLTF